MEKSDIKYRGFTFVEVLISMALTAMILTAMATAFNAYATNYQQNHGIYQTTNDARQALTRMTTQLRTATAVDPNNAEHYCKFISSQGDTLYYYFSDYFNKIFLLGYPDYYTICDNVIDASFVKNTALDGQGFTYVKSIQISMTLRSDGVTKTFPAAVTLRRNLD